MSHSPCRPRQPLLHRSKTERSTGGDIGFTRDVLCIGFGHVGFTHWENDRIRLQSAWDVIEIYTAFGSEMKSPLQILEPTSGSAHGSVKTNTDGESDIEIRAAALSLFDFTFSMHDAALLSAILNSLQVSFSSVDGSSGEIESLSAEGLMTTKQNKEHNEKKSYY